MSVILLPENLRSKLGDQAAKELVELINSTDSVKKNTIDTSDDRFGRSLGEFKGEIKALIAESKSETIKWMFVFWLGQLVALAGVIAYLK